MLAPFVNDFVEYMSIAIDRFNNKNKFVCEAMCVFVKIYVIVRENMIYLFL